MKGAKKRGCNKFLRIVAVLLCCLLMFVAFLAFFSANWYLKTYGQLGFDAILYTLLGNFNGVESNLLIGYAVSAIIPAVVVTTLLSLLLFIPWKKKLEFNIFKKFKITMLPVRRCIAIILSITCSIVFTFFAASSVQLGKYLLNTLQQTAIFNDEYVDPETANITFPEKKRNLIYIFMESMETTFFSTEQGGALEENVIPELYDIAEKNVNFSNNDKVGGLKVSGGSGWTIAAMVSQTSGLPLKTPLKVGGNEYGANGEFLPGATTITDVLHKNGYYQSLMVGSEAEYGGRKAYFEGHGVDRVYELSTAKEDGIVAPDYRVWWGMEDLNLYKYAKQELKKISKKDQPFAFFMLTVDTHHVDGYQCSNCKNTHENQYENVLSCASKQLSSFLKWIKKQKFYKDTTIVIVGDHPTMDEAYIQSVEAEDFPRTIYNCFVNSAVEPVKNRERVAYSLDLFPTTLAAMGCKIEGERLGLGTNLFSSTPTLGETMGADAFNDELSKSSNFYSKKFLFNQEYKKQ
jgi:phosphoglycerol transferase